MIVQILVKQKTTSQTLDYEVPDSIILENYQLVRVPFRNKKILGIVISQKTTSAFTVKPIGKVLSKGPIFNDYQIALAKKLEKSTLSNFNDIIFSFLPGLNVKDLAKIGLKTRCTHQKNAQSLFFSGSWQQRLEFYGQNSVTFEKQILVVLPTIEKIKKATKILKKLGLNIPVYSWHSKISRSQKSQLWQSALSGEPLLVIGSRHSLFLPFTNLKQVFLDDPSNFAYHDDQAPYYNAYDVTKELSKITGCSVTYASSLCDLKSFAQIKKSNLQYIENKTNLKIAIKGVLHKLLQNPAFNKFLEDKIAQKKRVLFIGKWQKEKQLFCLDCQKNIPDSNQTFCPFCQSIKLKFLGQNNIQIKNELEKLSFLKNKVSTDLSVNLPIMVAHFDDFELLKPPFDTAILPNFDFQANAPYVNARLRLFAKILDLQDLYISQIIICSENHGNSQFISQILENKKNDFLNQQLLENQKSSLPPFRQAVKIVSRGKSAKLSENKLKTFIDKTTHFKPIGEINLIKKKNYYQSSIIGLVTHRVWPTFIDQAQNNKKSNIHLEIDPAELI